MTQSRLLFKQWLLGNNFWISLTVLWLFCYCHFLIRQDHSFGYPPFPLSTCCFWNKKKLYFGSTSALKSSFPLHRRPKIILVNLWQLMTASNVSVRTQAWKVGGFKIPGFVCKLFLPLFPTPPLPTILLAPFFALSLTLIPSPLLQSRKETLATQARPWTTSSPKNSLSSPTNPTMCDKCRL